MSEGLERLVISHCRHVGARESDVEVAESAVVAVQKVDGLRDRQEHAFRLLAFRSGDVDEDTESSVHLLFEVGVSREPEPMKYDLEKV